MNKLLATIKSTSTTKDGSGSFEAVLSVPTEDRDGEILDANAFAPLPEHITIDVDHAMTVEKTIGSGRPFYEGDLLKFEGTYASTPLAQMVRTLVDEGHIRTMSVAYMNAVYGDGDDGLPHLRKGELLNAGIVGIPSNREALITASKGLVDTAVEIAEVAAKSGARHSTKDLTLIQSAHDALEALGAACTAKTPDPSGEEPTDTDAKAAATAAEPAPVVPAPVSVEVAKAMATVAAAELALLT